MDDTSQFLLELIQPHKWEEFIPLAINEFVFGEPMAKGIQATPEDFHSMLKKGVQHWIGEGISVCAKDARTGKPIGMQIATIVRRGDNLTMWSDLKATNEKTFCYTELEKVMENAVDLFSEDPLLERVLEQNLLVVDSKHTGRGIGTLLVKKTEELGREKGCQVAIVEASGLASQTIFSKLGYETRFEYPYENFEIEGKKVFDLSLMGGTTKNTIMVKKL